MKRLLDRLKSSKQHSTSKASNVLLDVGRIALEILYPWKYRPHKSPKALRTLLRNENLVTAKLHAAAT